MSTLSIRGLSKSYGRETPSAVTALHPLDIEIAAGERMAIIGSNGAGKSTLLQAIAGSISIDTGTIALDGTRIESWPEHRRSAWISRVFQDPQLGTAGSLSIAENLALAACRGRSLGLKRAVPAPQRQAWQARLSTWNLDLDQAARTLSGGQRQALTLEMAMLAQPRLLLLDEPTAALDPKSAQQWLRQAALRLENEPTTTLLVTHSMAAALELGTRIVMLHQGRVVEDWSASACKSLSVAELVACFSRHEQASANTIR